MKLELEHQLVSNYPNLFKQYGGDPKDTCLAFGIECGDGWYHLIDTLCGAIQSEVDWINRLWPELDFSCSAVQVKEKLGELRFYYEFFYKTDLPDEKMKVLTGSMDRIAGMTFLAENMSETICESCGGKCELEDAPFPRAECDACATLRRDAYDSKENYDE
jgi:hypothetical protein